MRKSQRICIGAISCIALVLLFLAPTVSAQNGRWVEYSLDGFPAGSAMSARGDGCLGFTRTPGQKLLVFDINVHEWLEIDLGSTQTFRELMTEGQVVFAVTDNLLFGYSALSQTWDTITYTGEYMSGSEHPQDCGNYLAYLVTADYMYVFDAALGLWQSYDFGFSAEFTGVNSWLKDDYIGMLLSRDYPNQPMNVVYSAHTQSFNQLQNGTYKPSPLMDHGFAGLFNINYDGQTYRLIGYSAFTNTFDVVDYVCGDDEAPISISGAGTMPADKFTNKVYGFRYVVPYESVTVNFYGFDTRRGSWDHTTMYFDWDIDHYYGNWYQSGEFSFDQSLFTADNTFHIYFYDGADGIFRDYATGLVYKSTTSAFGGGGTVFCVFDTLHAWGYDIVEDRGSMLNFALDKTANFYRGDDFLTLTRWSIAADTMITYFYNGNTNRWSSVTVAKDWNTNGTLTAHLYLHKGSPENETIFYSAYQDTIVKADFEDDLYVYYKVHDPLACARSDEKSILFDGLAGETHEFNFEFSQNGMGFGSAVFCDTIDDTWYGYSALSQSFTTRNTPDVPYYVVDTGYIGLITVNYYNKFYAYNGLGDSWVELIPEGAAVSFIVGEKTIIITRSDRVYAFDPQGDPSDAGNNAAALPGKFTLSQNHPNPFNLATEIEYSIGRRDHVEIAVFNLLGQKVKTLVDEIKPAGKYRVVWDGMNSAGRPVASGVYFYRLTTGDFADAKKMILLK